MFPLFGFLFLAFGIKLLSAHQPLFCDMNAILIDRCIFFFFLFLQTNFFTDVDDAEFQQKTSK